MYCPPRHRAVRGKIANLWGVDYHALTRTQECPPSRGKVRMTYLDFPLGLGLGREDNLFPRAPCLLQLLAKRH
jgi:hypothetical protein